MTVVTAAFGATADSHPGRWRLTRAGIVNIWHYLDNEFDLSGGRMILRGTNGSGKSRALEMLLPFLLDADRRKMDATGSAKVSIDELMRTGAGEQTNRIGYLWLELERPEGHLTVGALLRYSRSANQSKVWYFTTPLRVGRDLLLLSPTREALTREALGELIGAERITDLAEAHRERVRTEVFGLRGEGGRDRFAGLLQLLHTLRSPDVGNRIDEGKLPQILRDSLPPLGEAAISRAGEQLDGLTETRQAQQRLERSREQVDRLAGVYRRYAGSVLLTVADATEEAVRGHVTGLRQAQQADKALEATRREASRAEAAAKTVDDELRELDTAIEGIKSREIFKNADDLVQRDAAVDALAQAANSALGAAEQARRHHRQAVARADDQLNAVESSVHAVAAATVAAHRAVTAAGLSAGGLTDAVRLVRQPASTIDIPLQITLHGSRVPVARPEPVAAVIFPSDLTPVQQSVVTAHEAAVKRNELAGRRLEEAIRLEKESAECGRLDDEAGTLRTMAEDDAGTAAERSDAADSAAVALARAWRTWTAEPATADLLSAADWSSTPVAPLLLDLDALITDPGTDLAGLDGCATDAAGAARDKLTERRTELIAAQREDELRRESLMGEQSELRDAKDRAPADPPWLRADRPGVPFWRAVDFDESLDADARAGLEAALQASGLLTASLESDGAVRAESGEIFLGAGGSAAARPLTAALHADPDSELPAAAVEAALAGIGLDDPQAFTSVSFDGRWRHGRLHGRYQVAEARHIGASARAQRRRVRLAEIDTELAALAAAESVRTEELQGLRRRDQALREHLRTAPTSRALFTARTTRDDAHTRAEKSRMRAEEAGRIARARRDVWSRELATHRQACRLFDLPEQFEALRVTHRQTESASVSCRSLQSLLESLTLVRQHHDQALQVIADERARRDAAETQADEQWATWRDLASEVAAQHEAIQLSVDQAKQELGRSLRERESMLRNKSRLAAELDELRRAATDADSAARQAVSNVDITRAGMISAANELTRRIRLPGLLAAVSDLAVDAVARAEHPESVSAVVARLRAVVRKPAQPASETSVLTAFQSFDREISGHLDAVQTMDHGVVLIEIAGAGDDHTLAGAARDLASRVEAGRSALTEREREVFTTFVLGGVAEELRRQVNQAKLLVKAMNSSLIDIHTSNGIGVRIGWKLADEAVDLRRVLDLVATSDAIRTAAQNDELTDLLRRRVEEQYAADPSSGYAVHLATALDYRRWHEVDVVILGPDPGQERRISKRAKLSQGETRFVSYVTLFAAADGYLSGLPDTDRALRLILLDDAFAKVDDPTIAELMGLLVHLDLDFVMTGHALWGCFPQVPKLDIYEVRRQDGSSAVTTHVHWDGHRRHLRVSA